MSNSTLMGAVHAHLTHPDITGGKDHDVIAAAPSGRRRELLERFGAPARSYPAFPGVARPRLVICAITRPEGSSYVPSTVPDDVEAAIRRLLVVEFKFPSGDLLAQAAAMFVKPITPAASRSSYTEWRPVTAGVDNTRTAQLRREGPVTYLDIAPGLVRLRRTDPNRTERAAARVAARKVAALAERAALVAREAPRLLDAQRLDPEHTFRTLEDSEEYNWLTAEYEASQRGLIAAWSAKSRARMVSTICELDLSQLVAGDTLPGMVTLTLPGDWLAVAPNHATMTRKFDNFLRAWAKKFGAGSANIWKREFQRRGAPHYHLWLVPPVMPGGLPEFRRWLSLAWTTALSPDRSYSLPAGVHGPLNMLHTKPGNLRCGCSEWCRSLSAGTGLDFAEAMRARDPRRLAVYFLKESLGGEGKAYQNRAPVEWLCGWVDHAAGVEGPQPKGHDSRPSMGRFWGYRGISKSVMTVEVEPSVGTQVARAMRRWQRAQGVTREVRAVRTDARTGTVRRGRPTRRRSKVIGAAGWIAVNDGATFAAGSYTVHGVVGGLERMVQRLTDQLAHERSDGWATDRRRIPEDTPGGLGGFLPVQHGPFREGEFYCGPAAGYYPQPQSTAAGPIVIDLDSSTGVFEGDTLRNWIASDPNRESTW